MENAKRKSDRVGLIVMIVLAVVLLPVLVINVTLIIKGSVNKDVPPDIFGIAPLAVTSGSMEGENDDSFGRGALIFVRILDADGKNDLSVGDIVTFRSDGAYVTHRIISVNLSGGEVSSVVTQGDANNVNDGAVPVSNIVGLCVGSVEGLGSFSMFLQTPAGILVFVGIPVLLFIAYDIIRITVFNRRVKAEEKASDADSSAEENPSELAAARDELKAKDEELARLRALVAEKESSRKEEGGAASAEETEAAHEDDSKNTDGAEGR